MSLHHLTFELAAARAGRLAQRRFEHSGHSVDHEELVAAYGARDEMRKPVRPSAGGKTESPRRAIAAKMDRRGLNCSRA
jgi:hypothetical protein